MITKDYYEHINERLFSSDMLRGTAPIDLSVASGIREERMDRIFEILDSVEASYGFDMQRMYSLNIVKFCTWQKTMCDDISIDRIITAAEFVVFCCLADKFMDSRRFSGECKEHIVSSFLRLKTISPVKTDDSFEGKRELCLIWNDFVEGMGHNPEEDIRRSIILDYIRQAFASEEYMYRSRLRDGERISGDEMRLLIDKSVKFVACSFIISDDPLKYSERMDVFDAVGQLLWLIDDVCDLMEDAIEKRKNSLLFYLADKDKDLTIKDRLERTISNIDVVIGRVGELLCTLRAAVSEEVYGILAREVWEWGYPVRRALGRSE